MHELTEEALVPASVDAVWADFTDPLLLTQWIWPARFETTAEIDPLPLGRWEVRSASMEMAVLSEILEIDGPRALRLRWQWEGEDHSSDVGITLEPAADATRVIVRQSGLRSEEERASHVEGWSHCLQRLVERHA